MTSGLSLVCVTVQLARLRMRDVLALLRAGGIPTQGITDVVLGQIAEDVAAWNKPTGAFGKLNKQYDEVRGKARGVAVQYNLPQDQRQEQVNGSSNNSKI